MDLDHLLADATATPALCDSIAHMAPDDVRALLTDPVATAILNSYVAAQPFGSDHVAHYELLVRYMLPKIFAEVGTVETIAWQQHSKHVVSLRNVKIQRPTVGPSETQPRGLKVTLGGGTEELLPKEALTRSLTYALTVTTDVEHRAYELSEAPASAAVQLPVAAPDAFAALPTVWAELRRRTVWWDPTDRVPEPLEDALDKDSVAHNEHVVARMRDGTHHGVPAPLSHLLRRPSQLLADAATNIGIEHPMIHFLFSEWAYARADHEGVPLTLEGADEDDAAAEAAGSGTAAARGGGGGSGGGGGGAAAAAAAATTSAVSGVYGGGGAAATAAAAVVDGEGEESEEVEDVEEDKGNTSDKGGTAPVRRMHRYRERLRGPPVICHDLPIAALPCMLGCSFDNATALSATERTLHMGEAPGTFICRGTLKCLRSQNVQRANVWVMDGKYRGPVTASVRSLHPEKFRSSSTLYLYLAPSSTGASTVTVDVPFLPQYLPVITIFRFLGYESREAIEGVVFAGRDPAHPADAEARRRFASNFSDASMSKTLEELYEEAGSGMKKPDDTPEKRRRQVHMQITTELLPQVGYDDSAKTRLKKAIFLGLIIRDMLKMHLDKEKAASCKNTRDFEGNKCVEMSAVILSRMLRQLVQQFMKLLRNKIFDRCKKGKHLDVLSLVAHMETLTRSIMKAFSDGEVTVQKDASNSGLGVILVVEQANALAVQTDVERVSTALPRDGKYVTGRALDCSTKQSYGPAETPEGPTVGLLQNPAVCARVRLGTHTLPVTRQVFRLGEYAAAALALDMAVPASGGGSGGGGVGGGGGGGGGGAAGGAGRASTATATATATATPKSVEDAARAEAAALEAWCASPAFIRPLTTLDDVRSVTCPVTPAGAPHFGAFVFVNGEPVGVTDNEELFARVARQARRDGVLPVDCSIVRDEAWRGVAIFTDIGMLTRALLHLPSIHKLSAAQDAAAAHGTQLWDEMTRLGIVDWVDAWEAAEYRVADLPAEVADYLERRDALEAPYTHITPHPQSFFATAEATVPFPDHDQGPRVCYQSAMAAQSMSAPSSDAWERIDFNTANLLWYPQRPLASTDLARAKGLDDFPMGQNAVIAIAINGGLDQEDAIIINEDSQMRGFMRATVLEVKRAVAKSRGGTDLEVFEHPLRRLDASAPKTDHIRGGVNYDKIGIDGLPSVGERIVDGDVIVGKTMTSGTDLDATGRPRTVCRDRSVVMTCDPSEVYYVDKVAIMPNKEGHRMVRVRLRTTRLMQEGDKASARHGQKGTIGERRRQWDMPFVESGPNAGLVPDLIINCHSINGRMTLGMLLEMIFSALGVVRGQFVDATPFRNVSARWAIEQLVKSSYGVNVPMINGCTGERMTSEWFNAICFYQRLKHMAIEKLARRQRGLRAALTRQPMGGKTGGQAQRFGAMEGQTLLAHGAAFAADDAMRVRSDSYRVPICLECETIVDDHAESLAALVDTTGKGGMCRLCGKRTRQVMLDTTYCNVLWQKEVAGLGIKVTADMGVKVRSDAVADADDDLPFFPDMPDVPEDEDEGEDDEGDRGGGEEGTSSGGGGGGMGEDDAPVYSKERLAAMLEFLRSQRSGATELADDDAASSVSSGTSVSDSSADSSSAAASDASSDESVEDETDRDSFTAKLTIKPMGHATTKPASEPACKISAQRAVAKPRVRARAASASSDEGTDTDVSDTDVSDTDTKPRAASKPSAKRVRWDESTVARVADAGDLRRMWGAQAAKVKVAATTTATTKKSVGTMVSDLSDALAGMTYDEDE